MREFATTINEAVGKPGNWSLSEEEREFFLATAVERERHGKPQVLWGWKRDLVVKRVRRPESRTVYFSADLAVGQDNSLRIARPYFFLASRAKDVEIRDLAVAAMAGRRVNHYPTQLRAFADKDYPGYSWLRLEMGTPTAYDRATVSRRLKGSPRLVIEAPRIVSESLNYDISGYAPLAVCCGSGLSAEAGLPLLGTIHNLFEVDGSQTGRLIFGKDDRLPVRVLHDSEAEFRKFCQFSVDAIKAKPANSHQQIAELVSKGIVRQVFTDNMDDILRKVRIPYVQTRQSIFPDRYPVSFDPEIKALLVIGVAVDRRDVIKQARRAGLKIIVINPVLGVAPHSRNMDYLREGDIFFRKKAGVALPEIISASKF